MKTSFLLLLITWNYALAFTLPVEYISGTELCKQHDLSGEFGEYIEVPAYYDGKNNHKTKIYFYTKNTFNPKHPSLIFFTGGPGVSSRSTEFEIPNTNVIFFEQRGISCSKPDTQELYLDPNFYSSENTAKDAKAILDFLGIKKATIYGQSYGTIPATIFASLFKSKTNALIIEGVIYEGNESLWHSRIKKDLLQQFFNRQPENIQAKILTLSQSGKLPKTWFSKLGGMMLYMNNGIETFQTFFDNIITMEENDFINFVLNFYPSPHIAEDYSFGDVMMGMIGCQEISMSDSTLSLDLEFNGNILNFSNISSEYQERCVPLNLTSKRYVPYRAINYPVFANTYYFLGENDGATDIHQGMNHFRNVAKIDKNLIILKKGGHLPALGLLKDNRHCNQQEENCDSLLQNNQMANIFSKITAGEKIEQLDIENLNQLGELQFKLTR
jgi:proline iminopeptidase